MNERVNNDAQQTASGAGKKSFHVEVDDFLLLVDLEVREIIEWLPLCLVLRNIFDVVQETSLHALQN